MKCPYVVNQKYITLTHSNYDEDGHQTDWIEVQNNNAEFTECLKEECAAYNAEKQKCEYRGC